MTGGATAAGLLFRTSVEIMKALVSSTPGPANTLEIVDAAKPSPGAGEICIRVASCGINYPDTLMIDDRYQTKPPRPFSPGGEVAGTVEVVGPDVADFSIGDRVAALTYFGGLAEYVCTTARQAVRLDADMDGAQSAMILSTYATCYYALIDRGALKRYETLLVLGGSGGLGSAAIQIGKALGARIIAGVSSSAKAEEAYRNGADEVVVYPQSPSEHSRQAASAFKDAVDDGGANVVFDPVGGTLAEAALRSVAWGGRYLVLGFTAGIPSPPWNLPLLKGCAIVGVLFNEFERRNPDRAKANLARLFEWYRAGKLVPRVAKRYMFEDAREAIASVAERRAVGKLVVDINRKGP